MLDHLRLAIPLHAIYVNEHADGTFSFNGDLLSLGLPCASRSVYRDDRGEVCTGELYAVYESLPSSYTDMAFKFYHNGGYSFPYVELKASPAKLFQGHNVYGSQNIEQGACQMLFMLCHAYPDLIPLLDIKNTQVLHLDATFSARLPHQAQIPKVLEFMSNLSAGHRKAREVKYNNYISWGGKNPSIGAKAYGKLEEVASQMKLLEKQAKRGDPQAKKLYFELTKVYDYANALLRFESRITKTYLTKNGYPSNLWELIAYQGENPDLLKNLWGVAFNPIFNTLKGEKMRFKNNDEMEQTIKNALKSTTPSGRISYAKANQAIALYRAIRDKGFAAVKQDVTNGELSKASYYRHLKLLTEQVGISKAHLQNLHNDKASKVIPFVQMVEIKFGEQTPPDFVEPICEHADLFTNFKLPKAA